MSGPQKLPSPPSSLDGDGVRITRRALPGGQSARRAMWLVLLLAMGCASGYWLLHGSAADTHAAADRLPAMLAKPSAPNTPTPVRATPRSAAAFAPTPSEPPDDYTSLSDDANDLAAYVSSDDPEPSMAEVIEALHHNGIHSGLGAFNPPGTSPPLHGLAVPKDFDLPEGYVRHYQVTDDGEAIEPILMFSPDFEFHDDAGQLVEIPADRVVPPELAPPGMPIQPVEIPELSPDAG